MMEQQPWKRRVVVAGLATVVVGWSTVGMAGTAETVRISEVRFDQPGPDNDEYLELTGPPATTLSGLTYLVIGDGAGGSGVIEVAIDLTDLTLPADGVLVIGEASLSLASPDVVAVLNLENSDNFTHLLVRDFASTIGADLDADDDCILDDTPWSDVLDAVAIVEDLAVPPTTTECYYADSVVGPDASGEAPFHVYRCGGDGPWQAGDNDPATGLDTPGMLNPPCAPTACTEREDCGDTDQDGRPDDTCSWYACIDSSCTSLPRAFGDVGGNFGDCEPDGFVGVHDRNHVLACFSRISTCSALNLDIGGSFGSCIPDGHCNIHDANHVMVSMTGAGQCSCPSGPWPDGPTLVGEPARLTLRARAPRERPGGLVAVDVFVTGGGPLNGYQLQLMVSGGWRGHLSPYRIHIDPQRAGDRPEVKEEAVAFDTARSRMLRLLPPGGPGPVGDGYLATFEFQVSPDAVGAFVIDVRGGHECDGLTTALIGPEAACIPVGRSQGAVVMIDAPAPRSRNGR